MSANERSRNIVWAAVAILALLVAVVAAVRFFRARPAAEPQTPSATAVKAVDGETRKTKPKPKRIRSQHKHDQGDAVTRRTENDDDDDDDDDDISPEDRKLQDAIDKALEDEDLKTVRSLASQAMTAKSAEVRQSMVEALGWFGVKALPELTPFLADPDEDVRSSAMDEWSMAVSDIEDDAEKLGIVELAMNVLNEEDPLEDISNEYIGVDEKLAVESLLRVIEAGGSVKGIEKAKETYEFVTGETFTDRAAAEKWIAEEYEPTEKEDQK